MKTQDYRNNNTKLKKGKINRKEGNIKEPMRHAHTQWYLVRVHAPSFTLYVTKTAFEHPNLNVNNDNDVYAHDRHVNNETGSLEVMAV